MKNILSGFADEAGPELSLQIRATKELGWNHVEMRNVQVGNFPNCNLHDIPDEAFLLVVDQLAEAGVWVHCFGSGIANGSKSVDGPFVCLESAKRAAKRMSKLGTQFIRVMSYPIVKGQNADQKEGVRFVRLREIQKVFNDAGLTVVHENCGNYGGMGWAYA